MSGDALFATAPFDEGAGCACCGSREHATNGCPTGVAADLWTGHGCTCPDDCRCHRGSGAPCGCRAHDVDADAVDALREQYLATSNYVATWREADEWAREHAS